MEARFARLAAAALVALGLTACSTPVPLATPAPAMSEISARETLVGLRGGKVNAWVNADGRQWVASGKSLVIGHDALHFNSVNISLQDITSLSTVLTMNNNFVVTIGLAGGRQIELVEQNIGDAIPGSVLAAAIARLRQAAPDAAAQATDFEQAAATYRAATSRPEPGERQRHHEVQAEAYVRDKQFLRAAETYAEAVAEVPAWPQGHFNFALVLETLGDYELAIEEMQHYLALVPEAENARAAQDKIYEWETHLPTGASR
jgi:hypothetical protein